jgi:hypothetical protein
MGLIRKGSPFKRGGGNYDQIIQEKYVQPPPLS